MNLGKFLAIGRSLRKAKDRPGRYQMTSRGLLPKFSGIGKRDGVPTDPASWESASASASASESEMPVSPNLDGELEMGRRIFASRRGSVPRELQGVLVKRNDLRESDVDFVAVGDCAAAPDRDSSKQSSVVAWLWRRVRDASSARSRP